MIRSYRLLIAVILVIYLGLQLIAFGLDSRQKRSWYHQAITAVTYPGQKLFTVTFGTVKDVANGYIFLMGAAKENAQLKADLDHAHYEISRLREAQNELNRIQSILGLPPKYFIELIPADRVAMGVSPFQRTLRVSHSTKSDVTPGMQVVSNRGVVGQVISSKKGVSDVLLLVDKSSAIDVIDQRSRVTAILRGADLDRLKFEYTKRGVDIAVGDEVLSSGLDGVYQKGLPVGVVTDVKLDPKQLYLEAYVTPYVDFANLETVGIGVKVLPVPEPTVAPEPTKTTDSIEKSTKDEKPTPSPKPTDPPKTKKLETHIQVPAPEPIVPTEEDISAPIIP